MSGVDDAIEGIVDAGGQIAGAIGGVDDVTGQVAAVFGEVADVIAIKGDGGNWLRLITSVPFVSYGSVSQMSAASKFPL